MPKDTKNDICINFFCFCSFFFPLSNLGSVKSDTPFLLKTLYFQGLYRFLKIKKQ